MIVIGIDGSLRATGLVAVERTGRTWRVLHASCVLTEPGEARFKAQDDGARVDVISREVEALILRTTGSLRAVAVEAPAGSQNASSAKGLALAYGAIRTTLRMLGITPEIVTAHEARKLATGSTSASKEDVGAAMFARYPLPQAKRTAISIEAIGDALALAHVLVERLDARERRAA